MKRTTLFILAVLLALPLAAKPHKVTKLGQPDEMPHHAPVQKVLPVSRAIEVASAHDGHVNQKTKEGIDVSHYQGAIDWKKVAADNVSYAYVKATEGESYVDDTYAYNIREARKNGISVGAYHFYRTNVSVDKQFANMTAVVKKEDCDLVPMIDVETRGKVSLEQFVNDLHEFVKRVEKYYGRKPILYSYQNFYNKFLSGEFKNYPWMIAKYDAELPLLDNGPDFVAWQYSSSSYVNGIKSHCDRSRLVGRHTLKELKL